MIRRRTGPRTILRLVSDTLPPSAVLRFLCVDDEEDIRTILELALTLDPGIQAEVVSDGETMLEKAAAGGYDMFVLDAMMPGMDGYEVCRRLKASAATRDVPTVFLTAKTQRDEVERAQSLGAIAVLRKPFDPMMIAGELRDLLGKARNSMTRSA